jgi:DNA-binding protein HU-beta
MADDRCDAALAGGISIVNFEFSLTMGISEHMMRPVSAGGSDKFIPSKKQEETEMTKGDLINAVAASKALPKGVSKKAVLAVIDETFDQIKKAVKKDDKFTVPGFGTFAKKKRAARTGRNPQTGERIKIKPSTTVGFRAAQALKTFVGGGKKS